jgi:hypothetical protein
VTLAFGKLFDDPLVTSHSGTKKPKMSLRCE